MLRKLNDNDDGGSAESIQKQVKQKHANIIMYFYHWMQYKQISFSKLTCHKPNLQY